MSIASQSNPEDSRNVSSTSGHTEQKCYELEIINVSWLDSIAAARAGEKITPPHWRKDIDNNEDNNEAFFHYSHGSKKPAIYSIYGSKDFKKPKLQVTIKTVESKIGQFSEKDINKTAYLKAELGTMHFESTKGFMIPENNNIVIVIVEINNAAEQVINKLKTFSDNALWRVICSDRIYGLKSTRLEVFFIHENIIANTAYLHDGIWVEALRFLFKKTEINHTTNPRYSAKEIARYCHERHGLIYDSKAGAPHYGVNGDGGTFRLLSYLQCNKKLANSYDQAAAMQSLCWAVGINSQWLYAESYGVLNGLHLLGHGYCNNPFFEAGGNISKEKVVRHKLRNNDLVVYSERYDNETYLDYLVTDDCAFQSYFRNHAFICLTANGSILDASAGPALGDNSLEEYKTKFISASGNDKLGIKFDCKVKPGVTGISWG